MIKTVDNAIQEALKIAFPTLDVESFPIEFKQYNFTSANGCLLVKYQKSTFQNQDTVWEVAQGNKIRFSVIAGYRGLNKYSEAYLYQQLLKDTLQGLEILGRKLTLVEEQFLAELNTDLYWGLTVEINLWQEETCKT